MNIVRRSLTGVASTSGSVLPVKPLGNYAKLLYKNRGDPCYHPPHPAIFWVPITTIKRIKDPCIYPPKSKTCAYKVLHYCYIMYTYPPKKY